MMKNTNRALTAVLCIILAMTLCIQLSPLPVKADETNLTALSKAEALNKLSLVYGDNGDYNLKGKLKRSEAAAFIVRLIGKEAYVKENADFYKFTKFSDVNTGDWFAPYVGYCSEQKIISGFDGKYNPNDNISERAFVKLVMNVLGYKDGTDITWGTVFTTACSAGLITDISYLTKADDNNQYTREDFIKLIYKALTVKKKDSKYTLLREFINSKIVDPEAAVAAGFVIDTTSAAVYEAVPVHENKLAVSLNEEIELIGDSNIAIYETVHPDNKVTASVQEQGNGQLVIKTSILSPEKAYTLLLSNIKDMEGNTYDKLSKVFIGYESKTVQSELFKLSKVEAEGSSRLNVYFTQPVSVNSELPSYYEIIENGNIKVSGSFQTMTAKASTTDKSCVKLYLKDFRMTEGAEYTLRVSGELTGAYGIKLNSGIGDNIEFRGRSGEAVKLAVHSVRALDSRAIEVEYNMEVDEFYGQQFLNYMLKAQDGTIIGVNKAMMADSRGRNGSVIILGVQGAIDRTKNYELTVNYLTDVLKSTTVDNIKAAFSGAYDTNTDLHITGVGFNDKGSITLQLDKALDAESSETASLYSVTGVSDPGFYANPVKVLYEKKDGKHYAKLYFSESKYLSPGQTYKVNVSREIKFHGGSKSTTDAVNEFVAGSTDNIKPAVIKAVLLGNDAIKVVFSEEIALESPNISPANYTLEFKAGTETIRKVPLGIVTVEGDYKNLILKFDSLDSNTSYTLKCISLKDYGVVQTNIGQSAVNVTLGK